MKAQDQIFTALFSTLAICAMIGAYMGHVHQIALAILCVFMAAVFAYDSAVKERRIRARRRRINQYKASHV